MIGTLKPCMNHIDLNSKDYYRTSYCSLCWKMRKKFGNHSGLLLSTEISIVLSAFIPYMDRNSSFIRCPLTLFTKKKSVKKHLAITKASEWGYILAWLKLADDQSDQPSVFKTMLFKRVNFYTKKIIQNYSAENQKLIQDIRSSSVAGLSGFSTLINLTGKIGRVISFEIGSETNIPKQKLMNISKIFEKMGQLICVADPLLDIEEDIEKGAFNPISENVIKTRNSLIEEYTSMFNLFLIKKTELVQALKKCNDKGHCHNTLPNIITSSLNRLENRIQERKKYYIIGKPEYLNHKKSKGIILKLNQPIKLYCCGQFCDDCCECCEYGSGNCCCD